MSATTEHLEVLGANLVDDDVAALPPDRLAVPQKRVKIVLEENDQIAPTGQFFGAQGVGYILRPGEVADVPMSLINILNTAITDVPVTDPSTNRVMGYRPRLRFPYRLVVPQ